MPRIDTLQQGGRLQVTSPVPIASSGSARIEGEAIQGAGDQLTKTSIALLQFRDEADKEHNRVRLAALAEKYRSASIQAQIEAETKFQKSDGSDQLEVYDKTYQELTKGLADEFEGDSKLKANAAMLYDRERNDKAQSIAQSMIKRKIDAVKLDREKTVGDKMANIMLQPFAAKQHIQENNNTLDSLVGTYAPDEISQLKSKEAKQMAYQAVSSLITDDKQGVERFKAAEELVNGDLAEYLGADGTKVLKEIREAKVSYENDEMEKAYRAQRAAREAKREMQDDNAGKIYTAIQSAKSPAEIAKIKNESLKMMKQGLVSQEGYKAAFATPAKEAREEISDLTRLKFMNDITAKKSLVGMNEKIMKANKDGFLTSNDAAGLLTQVASERKSRKTGDKTFSDRKRLAENILKREAGGEDPFGVGELIVPKGKLRQFHGWSDELYRRVSRGEDPVAAANKIVEREAGVVVTTKFVAPQYVPMSEQGSLESMNAYEPEFREKMEELRKKGKTKEVLEQMKIWKDRKDALQKSEKKGSK